VSRLVAAPIRPDERERHRCRVGASWYSFAINAGERPMGWAAAASRRIHLLEAAAGKD